MGREQERKREKKRGERGRGGNRVKEGWGRGGGWEGKKGAGRGWGVKKRRRRRGGEKGGERRKESGGDRTEEKREGGSQPQCHWGETFLISTQETLVECSSGSKHGTHSPNSRPSARGFRYPGRSQETRRRN